MNRRLNLLGNIKTGFRKIRNTAIALSNIVESKEFDTVVILTSKTIALLLEQNDNEEKELLNNPAYSEEIRN